VRIPAAVGAVAPSSTETGGRAWRQTTFYPFLHASRFGRGIVLDPRIAFPSHADDEVDVFPTLAATATATSRRSGLGTIRAPRAQIPRPGGSGRAERRRDINRPVPARYTYAKTRGGACP
jgi:hypothetical protein